MKSEGIKYIFWISSAVLLILMLFTAKDAGINCDEVLHYNHSQSVYNYFATSGADNSALNTPVTNLKYYGQSYDNIVTVLINWFGIEDAYSFRHIMSTLVGWLTILITALFAIWLAGYGPGIIVLLLFAVSPTFIGHTQNNLKDIPFALSYIAGIYFLVRYLYSDSRWGYTDIILFTLSMAFGVSIRAGGLILICYAFFFLFVFYFIHYLKNNTADYQEIVRKFLFLVIAGMLAWMISILLWPFALQSPIINVIESYKVMAHFPDTFRQIFEGRNEWSDLMPWYYLTKSMAITIPFIVLAGLVLFVIFSPSIFKNGKGLSIGLLLFTIFFPVVFVLYEKSNLYSSWRQFLFLYPGIVIIAAIGFNSVFRKFSRKYITVLAILMFAILAIHPLKFMIRNHPYYYLYYNQFVGGLKGAYSNYETDYYYVTQTEASDWLIDYLDKNGIKDTVKVKATYSVNWMFRNHPNVQSSYFRFEERSLSDWDYAIVVNRYIPVFQMKNDLWPPKNAIHTIYADGVPVCAVIKRESKEDFLGYVALNEGRNEEAVKYFTKVFESDVQDEMIFYNFAAALYNSGDFIKADSILKKGLEINPDFEPILMYLGNIARYREKDDEAIMYYERVIKANKKYFEAYVGLSELLSRRDLQRARGLLRECLNLDPGYKPAISALADTYRETNPEIAKKYDELANTIK